MFRDGQWGLQRSGSRAGSEVFGMRSRFPALRRVSEPPLRCSRCGVPGIWVVRLTGRLLVGYRHNGFELWPRNFGETTALSQRLDETFHVIVVEVVHDALNAFVVGAWLELAPKRQQGITVHYIARFEGDGAPKEVEFAEYNRFRQKPFEDTGRVLMLRAIAGRRAARRLPADRIAPMEPLGRGAAEAGVQEPCGICGRRASEDKDCGSISRDGRGRRHDRALAAGRLCWPAHSRERSGGALAR